MNGQISFIASCDDNVKISTTRFGMITIKVDFDNIAQFVRTISFSDETDILNLIDTKHIIEYLEDKGYCVTPF